MLKLQEVLRVTRPPGREYMENDAEHSYQLAMTAWYLNDAAGLGLNLERILRYALVHDLAEAYAGDVTSLDYIGREGKDQRETAALKRIAAKFPEFPELVSWVRRYDERSDAEAKLVYALDKLMPMLLTYLQDGKVWHELGWSREELLTNKDKTTLADPLVHELWLQLRKLLAEQPELFPRA